MPGDNSFVVLCSCGKKLKAPAGSQGKKARCPACGNIVTLTAPKPVAAAPSVQKMAAAPGRAPGRAPAPMAEDDGFGAMYDLADQENTTAVAGSVAACPQCRKAMAEGAVFCTSCGYDTRTGKALAAPTVERSTGVPAAPRFGSVKKQQPIDYMAPTGSFMLGIAYSTICAVVASGVWFLFAYFTGITIGYIAILIGAAAGIGMRAGHRGYSALGGYAAAGITLFAILLAKFAVLEAALIRVHSSKSIADISSAKLAMYFFSPIGIVIMIIGMAAAFRGANGSVRD